MKAAVVRNNGIVIENIEAPFLKEKGAIVKVLGCGLCGSDIVKFKNKLVSDGTVLGHEAVGVIEEINSETDFKVGDKVVFAHHIPCFECVFCKNGNYSMCKHFKRTNIFPGGFCEKVFITEEHLKYTTFKIPENVTEVEASFMEPLACCLRAVKRAKIKKGDNVLISGLGSIGILMGQAAKFYGGTVIGCDVREDRLKLAKDFGFDKVEKIENFKKTIENIKIKTGHIGVDVVFLCSGAASAIDFAVESVRNGGTILVFSSIKQDEKTFKNNDIYYRELTILGSYSPSCEDLKEALEIIENKKIKLNDISKNYSLDKIEEAINDSVENKILKAYITP